MELRVVIQKDDAKSRLWRAAAAPFGIDLVPIGGSPIGMPFRVAAMSLRGARPAACCARYLNDYPSLLKTVLRVFSECTLVLLCRWLDIRLIWICHNVDRESERNHPLLSALRRKLFARSATAVLVLDEVLVDCAMRFFPRHEKKVRAISFGAPERYATQADAVDEALITKLLQHHRGLAANHQLNFAVLLCLGSPASEKSLHFEYVTQLVGEARKVGWYLVALVGGDFQHGERAGKLARTLQANPQVILFTEPVALSHSFITEHVDFYWRGYSDWSVPYTLYEAALLNKPVLALDAGALPILVEKHGLGVRVTRRFSNLSSALNDVRRMDISGDAFLRTHQWSRLAVVLRELLADRP